MVLKALEQPIGTSPHVDLGWKGKRMQPKRVLVVDDEPHVTMMLVESLEKLGEDYAIETAHSGEEALARVRQATYAVLITDYKMPGMNGLDLAQMVHRLSPETRIILMTAYSSETLRHTAGQMELDGYLSKPFSITHIRDMVRSAAGDPTTARSILIMEDESALLRLYTRALNRVGYTVYGAETLAEARELLARHRFDAFVCDVHVGEGRGTDLLREQGDALRKGGTQIVMVSADSRYRTVTEEMGVEFYLEKPVSISALVALVDRLTAQGQSS
jgi:two-component system response regulator (stage 0 sporulation protein F)